MLDTASVCWVKHRVEPYVGLYVQDEAVVFSGSVAEQADAGDLKSPVPNRTLKVRSLPLLPNKMSRSRGKLHKAECCPWCGTRTLQRDGFNPASHSAYSQVSYICWICNTGFSLKESPRAQYVNRMYAIERAQRPPDNEHVQKAGSPPLTERSLYELTRLEELLQAKHPASTASKQANAAQLANVRAELLRRQAKPGALTYQIGEVATIG